MELFTTYFQDLGDFHIHHSIQDGIIKKEIHTGGYQARKVRSYKRRFFISFLQYEKRS